MTLLSKKKLYKTFSQIKRYVAKKRKSIFRPYLVRSLKMLFIYSKRVSWEIKKSLAMMLSNNLRYAPALHAKRSLRFLLAKKDFVVHLDYKHIIISSHRDFTLSNLQLFRFWKGGAAASP